MSCGSPARALANEAPIQVHRLGGDTRPAEALDRPAASGTPHYLPRGGIGHEGVDGAGEVALEPVGVRGRHRIIRPQVDGDEEPRLAVDDHLRDPADGRGDHRRLAGRSLEVDDPERLVDRWTARSEE